MMKETIPLINRNLQEVTGQDIIKGCFEKNGTMNIYWGTAPTGRPHIAYFLPMTKIADFLKSNCHVTILFADLHAYLDNMKAPWELLEKRTEYYEVLIKGMLKALKVPLDKLRFIKGTDYQLNENYAKAVYQIIGITSIRDAAKAGCEVVKQVSDPLLSGIVYPLLQSIDEEFIGVDAQFGGVDQRKIFMYAEKYNPSLLCAKRAHLMNPMIPGLTGGKMSASEENSKIDLLDTEETVFRKLKSANCNGKTAETNGMLAFLKYIALPIKEQLTNETLKRYTDSEMIEKDFELGVLSEDDLKAMVGEILWSLMSGLREEFHLCNKSSLIEEAYPLVVEETNIESDSHRFTNVISECHIKALQSEFPQLSEISANQFPTIAEKPVIMWSCRSSGEPHIGYVVPLRHLAALSNRDWSVILLIEDVGAFLDSKHASNRPSWQQMTARARLYAELCKSVFELSGGNLSNLRIVFGSDFELTRHYTMSLYQSLSRVTEDECNKVCNTTSLSSLIYPCLSVLDQVHLAPTVRLFGSGCHDHRRQFDLILSSRIAEARMPLYVCHETVSALDGKTIMSSPRMVAKTAPKDVTSISLFDQAENVARKLKKAFFDPKSTTTVDPTLNIVETVVWPLLGDNEAVFTVARTAENGGDVAFSSVAEMRAQLHDERVHPGDVKAAAAAHMERLLLAPLRATVTGDLVARAASAFGDDVAAKAGKKPSKKAFSPNRADLRVAVVETVQWMGGKCSVSIKVGLDRFTIDCGIGKGAMRLLTPNDVCLVVVRASAGGHCQRAVGVLTDGGAVVRLARRPYMDVVAFVNHEVLPPHLREVDLDLVVREVEANCVAAGTALVWAADKSVANEIVLMTPCNANIKVERI